MKIAVAGLGFMGATHLKALRSISGATLSAVCSDDEQRLSGDLSAVAGNLGSGERFDFSGLKRYRKLDDLFADAEIEAVDLCLPTDLHESVAIAALRSGKHVLVEKPMALDYSGCLRMIEAARLAGRVLMAAHVLRFMPTYTALQIALTEVGTVRSVEFRRRCAMPGWGVWLQDEVRSGGGILDLLIHDVDMCLNLFGAPDFVSATGHADLSHGIDLIDARLFYSQGFVVNVKGGWHPGAFPFSMEYTISGDTGTIEYSSAGRQPTVFTASGPLALPLDTVDGYTAELAYFVDCCSSGNPPARCRPEGSAEAVRLTRLMLDSRSANGEKISCKLVNAKSG